MIDLQPNRQIFGFPAIWLKSCKDGVPLLNISPPLSCLHTMSHEAFLAGNSKRPEVHTFFIRFFSFFFFLPFPQRSGVPTKQITLLHTGIFFCSSPLNMLQFFKSKQTPPFSFLFPQSVNKKTKEEEITSMLQVFFFPLSFMRLV